MSERRAFNPADAGFFTVDDTTNQLYWKGQEIQTVARVSLSNSQNAWAVVVAVSTALAAVAAGISAYAALTAKPAVISGPPQILVCTTVIEKGAQKKPDRIVSRQCEPATIKSVS